MGQPAVLRGSRGFSAMQGRITVQWEQMYPMHNAGRCVSGVTGSQHLVCLQGCVQRPEYPSRFGLDRDGVSVLAECLEVYT